MVRLVIFPLISLKKDQISSLKEKGIKAVNLVPESSEMEIKNAVEGIYNFVFTTTVRFQVGFECKSRI